MLQRRSHEDFELEVVLAEKRGTVSVCIPARNSGELLAATIGRLRPLLSAGLLDQIVVIDGSTDGKTFAAAEGAGAEVHDEADLLPQFGRVLGKGDAMWRGLSVCQGDYVCFVDSDLIDFRASHIIGLLGPLFADEGSVFTKATYRRPLLVGDIELPDQGGRVTELTARPLLEVFEPRAAQFRQPLAGECAARRDLFESLEFVTGYGVEIAMLIDLVQRFDLAHFCEVDLGSRRNPNQSLEELGEMAREVVYSLVTRLGLTSGETLTSSRVRPRPPLNTFEPARSAQLTGT
jgi:glucosyl-3-phosphoglycerate synthase